MKPNIEEINDKTKRGYASLRNNVSGTSNKNNSETDPSATPKIDSELILKTDLGISTAPPNSPTGRPKPAHSDFQIYIPDGQDGHDSCNQHICALPLPNGEFFVVWTMGSLEGAGDQHIVFSKSSDCGMTWCEPQYLAGPRDDGHIASWAFPILAPKLKRIYVFYNKHQGYVDFHHQWTGQLWFQYSDDNGQTWSKAYKHLKFKPNSFSNKVADADPNWIVYQNPMITSKGDVLVGFTHVATKALSGEGGVFPSEVRFVRFDNILTENNPEKLTITTLPENGAEGLRVKDPRHPWASMLQEPTIQCLSDGRLFCVMRSATGYVIYSISDNEGATWSKPQVLRYYEGGPEVKQPIAPCPMYKLKDGRFVLIMHNNSGDANHGRHVADWCRNRRPVFCVVGREVPNAKGQPIKFSSPKIIADNDRIPISKKQLTEIGTYPSLFEYDGKVYFLFPDRKHYVLGKILSEELLNTDLPN